MFHKILVIAILTESLLGFGRVAAENSAGAKGPVPIDACALLGTAELEEAVGYSVSSEARSDSGYEANGSYSSTCLWQIRANATDSDGTGFSGHGQFVILNAMQWPDNSDLSRTFLDAFRDAAVRGELPTQPVPRDIGDEALWWGDGLAVRSGDVSFGVSVFMPDAKSTEPGAIEEELARHILRALDQPEPRV